LKDAIASMDVNMQDPADGNTLLHWAVFMNRKEMCEYLIAKGSRPAEPNKVGKSPFELAVDMTKADASMMPIRNYLAAVLTSSDGK